MSNRNARIGVAGVGLAMAGWMAAGAAGATMAGPACERDSALPQYNVVLFLLDDTSSTDIPFFNPPVQWATASGSTNPNDNVATRSEAMLRSPDYNRMAARLFAKSGAGCASTSSCGLGTNFLHPTSSVRSTTVSPYNEPPGGSFVPRCAGSSCNTSPDASNDILTTHGGMRRLAEAGVVFPRFYATSGRCTPTRASILTGLHPRQVGITDNGNHIREAEVTIADFLKSIPASEGTRAYATGVIGKWHVGATEDGSANTPWQRGFDEALYYTAGSREPWGGGPLQCSPPVRAGTQTERQRGFFCGSSLTTSVPIPCSGKDVDGNGVDDDCADVTGDKKCQAWGTHVGREASPTPGRQRVCPPGSGYWEKDCCAHPATIDGQSVLLPKKSGFFSVQNVYDFATKRSSQTAGSLYWSNENDPNVANSGQACLDDRHYADKDSAGPGCRYDTRFFRDMAVNFVSRHRDERFFLMVAFHSQHEISDAPRKTLAHHDVSDDWRAKLPDDADKFWGSMEEVDAAVGAVLAKLESTNSQGLGICENGTSAGASCSDSNGCTGGGTCNKNLNAQTVVLLTSDQGRPGAGYGSPMFRGGKGSTFEGGERVGLLAKIGTGKSGNSNVDTFAAQTLTDDAHVGSQVDIFPTVAAAAGCAPSSVTGYYRFGVRKKGQGEFCSLTSDEWNTARDSNASSDGCVDQDPTNKEDFCCGRELPGRSLLPYLKDAATPATTVRDAAYATFHGAPKAIMMARGADVDGDGQSNGLGICGIREAEAAGAAVPTDMSNPAIQTVRQAGSCQVCSLSPQSDGNAFCSGSNNIPCVSNGKFCVPSSDTTAIAACKVDGTLPYSANDCPWLSFPRCSPATSCSGVCIQVEVKCKTCEIPQWKLLASGGGGATVALKAEAMFDLSTNPEESEGQYKVGQTKTYPLNCALNPAQVIDPGGNGDASLYLRRTSNQLCRRLKAWDLGRRADSKAVTSEPAQDVSGFPGCLY